MALLPRCRALAPVIKNLKVHNRGWAFVPLADTPDESFSEQLQIRGYRVVKHEQRELVFAEPGEYVIDE